MSSILYYYNNLSFINHKNETDNNINMNELALISSVVSQVLSLCLYISICFIQRNIKPIEENIKNINSV